VVLGQGGGVEAEPGLLKVQFYPARAIAARKLSRS
jgi:hypothetical protein